MVFFFRTYAPVRNLGPSVSPSCPLGGGAPFPLDPLPGTLLTSWQRQEAAGSTAPSSSAQVVSCDCSPAEGCGRSRARGRGLPELPAARGGQPGRGKGAGKVVWTDNPTAAPPGRLGAPAPFSPPDLDPAEKSLQLEDSSAETFGGRAATPGPGCRLYPLKGREGRIHTAAGAAAEDTRLRPYGQRSSAPPRDATSPRTKANQSVPQNGVAPGAVLVRRRGR